MWGWFRDASVFASRSNRASRSASCANASGNTLIATCRPSVVSQRAIDLAHAAGAEGGQDFVGAETAAGGESYRYLIGTSRFNSSPQCCTTMICGGAAVWSEPPASFIIRNRWPSDEMSYVRPIFVFGTVDDPSFTRSVGVVAAHDGARSTPTRISAPVGAT